MVSNKPAQTRLARYKKGIRAERWARAKLRLSAYGVLTQRYKTPFGEIDVVARRGKTLVYVEVKARASAHAAFSAVSSQQQHRIVKAAHHFIAHYPEYANHTMRFDVICVVPRPYWFPRIIHVQDAWRP